MSEKPGEPFRPFAYLSYLLLRAAFGFVRMLPLSWSFALGRGLGTLFHAIDGKRRRIAERNLRLAFGDSKTEAEYRSLVQQSFQHFGLIAIESIIGDKYLTAEKWREYVDFPALEEIRALRAQGKGLIYIVAHLGNFELLALCVGWGGVPAHVQSAKIKNPYLDRYLHRRREATGVRSHPRRGGFRDILGAVREGEIVAFFPDQNQRKRPIFATWFGKLAATDRSPAFVALRFRPPMLVLSLTRVGKGFRYRVEVRPFHPPAPTGDEERDTLEFTESMNRALEETIRRTPEQYFWLHDRYRTRPPEG